MKEELFLEMANVFQKKITETVLELDKAGVILVEEDLERYEVFYPYIHLQAANKLKEIYGRKRAKQFQTQLEEFEITVLTVKKQGATNDLQ